MTENNLYFDGAKALVFTPLGNIANGQDNTIIGGRLFRVRRAD